MDACLLKRLQNVELRMLVDVDRFCRSYGVDYSLYGGTAIGAVRHGGFIPWDDDIDIVMTRHNYTKFFSAWRDYPLNGYYLQCIHTEEYCGITHVKIRKDNTLIISAGEDILKGHHGIWIDVFVVDKVPKCKMADLYIKCNCCKLFIYTRSYTLNSTENRFRHIIKKLLKIIPESVRTRRLERAYLNIQKYGEIKNGYYWFSSASFRDMRYRFPQNMFENYLEVEFEGHVFKLVKEYKMMLKMMYGDYMRLPPEEKRVCTHKPVRIEFGD